MTGPLPTIFAKTPRLPFIYIFVLDFVRLIDEGDEPDHPEVNTIDSDLHTVGKQRNLLVGEGWFGDFGFLV